MNYRHLSSVVSSLTLVLLFAGSAAAQSPVYEFAKQIGCYAQISAVDASGNIYITGGFNGTVDFDLGSGTANLTSAGAGGGWDIYLAKYTSSGNYVWAFRVGGSSKDNGSSIAFDGSGNIVIYGELDAGGSGVDFDPGSGIAKVKGKTFVAKYSPSGTHIWSFGLNLSLLPAYRNSLALDGSGNVYITGGLNGTCDFNPSNQTANLTGSGDAVVAKYNSSGTYQWSKKFIGVGVETTSNRMILDASGNFYFTGSFSGTVDFDPGSGTANVTSQGGKDIYLAKYNSSGAYLWAFGAGSTASDWSNSFVLDGSGNILVTGVFHGTVDFDPGSGTTNLATAGIGYRGMFLAKYSSSGAYLSAFQVGGTTPTNISGGNSIALDASGNIYAGGQFQGTVDFDPGSGTANLTSNGDNDGFIAKYSSSGAYLWAFGIGGTAGETVVNLVLSGTNIIAVGAFRLTTDFDPGSGTANLTAVGFQDMNFDYFLAKYSQSGGTKESARDDDPLAGEHEMTAAPNPFSSEFSFRCAGLSAPARLELLDLMGNVVENAVIIASGEAVNLGAGLPSGMYFLRVIQDGASRQMLVQKVR